MNIKDELIKYAKWYDRATMPEDAQTEEADLVQNVESYLQTEGKNIVLSDVRCSLPLTNQKLWEMAKLLSDKQKAAKEQSTDKVYWNMIEEMWFDWLEEELFGNYA